MMLVGVGGDRCCRSKDGVAAKNHLRLCLTFQIDFKGSVFFKGFFFFFTTEVLRGDL